MSLTVRWERGALNDLQRLSSQMTERVLNAVMRFAETRNGHISALKGQRGEYRLRVGEWRVLFRWDKETDTIHVRGIRPRGGAYRP